MKSKTLPVLLLICLLGLGALAAYQRQQIAQLRQAQAQGQQMLVEAQQQTVRAESDAQKAVARREGYEVAAAKLQEQKQALAAPVPASGNPKTDKAAEAKDGKAEGGLMKEMAKMYRDPKMKEMIRSQQAMAVNTIYAGLAKELGLNQDQAREVLDLLASRQMAMTEQGLKLMDDPSSAGEKNPASSGDIEAYNQELREVLGADGYGKFQDYEKSIGERVALEQFEKQLTAGGSPLSAEQSQGLLTVMTEERLQAPPSSFSPGTSQAEQLKALSVEGAVDQWVASQQTLNARILERARPLLSDDQFAALEAAQKQQLSMQQMGLEMGRQMLGKKK